MIQVRNLVLSFGNQTIFDDISCTFDTTQRVGVVGRNGAGKSTFLKVIADHISPDSGSIAIASGTKIAYMPQEVVLFSDKSVLDEALTVFAEFLSMQKRKSELETLLMNEQEQAVLLIEEYAIVQEKLINYDFSAIKARAERILKGLGFHDITQQKVNTLSVGWKMRLVLAKLLLQEADFYLFDEPTNHLDMITKQWFLEFLDKSSIGFLLVSHDKYYLEKSCRYIFELERAKGLLYTGNFTAYITQKEQQQTLKKAAFDRQQKEISRKQQTIDRFRASANKAKMAQSMIKQLEKIELIEIESPLPKIQFNFPEPLRSGATVLTIKNVQHAFSDKIIFKEVHAQIQRGEKVALVAPNGAGKTTLFNIIIGKYVLQQGAINFGSNVNYAVFEQDQMQAVKQDTMLYQDVLDACPGVSEATIRSFLGSFLFSGDAIFKKMSMLSGGERNRVALIKVLLQKANVLILDEPTNHLDLYSKEVLLQALEQYKGTVLLVCHDYDFLNKLSTRILELTSQGLYSYPGNYENYLVMKHDAYLSNTNPRQRDSENFNRDYQQVTSQSQSSSKAIFMLKKELSNLEAKISHLEKEIVQISQNFVDLQYGTDVYKKTDEKLQYAQHKLTQALTKWEELSSKLIS